MMLVGEIAQHFPDVGRKMLEENVLGEILKLKAPEEDKLWKTRDEKIDLLIHSLMNEEKLLKEKMKTLIIKFLQY